MPPCLFVRACACVQVHAPGLPICDMVDTPTVHWLKVVLWLLVVTVHAGGLQVAAVWPRARVHRDEHPGCQALCG